jgi:hypothetical protein
MRGTGLRELVETVRVGIWAGGVRILNAEGTEVAEKRGRGLSAHQIWLLMRSWHMDITLGIDASCWGSALARSIDAWRCGSEHGEGLRDNAEAQRARS